MSILGKAQRAIAADEWTARRGELERMLLAAKGQIAEAEQALADARTVTARIEGGLVELSYWEQQATSLPSEED